MSKIFINTNILVYSLDQFDPIKQKKCRSLLKTLTGDFRGVISTQVMQEFYVTTVKKPAPIPCSLKISCTLTGDLKQSSLPLIPLKKPSIAASLTDYRFGIR